MTRKAREEELMTRHLLGELSDAERQECEQRLFTDDDYFERLLNTENDLFDAYARGEMDPERRAHFERRLLSSPEQRQKLLLAKAMAGLAKETPTNSVPISPVRARAGWWPAMPDWAVALTLVIVLGALWLVAENIRLRQRIETAENDRAAQQQHAQELEQQVAEQRALNEELSAQLQRGQETHPERNEDQPDISPRGTERFSPAPAMISLLLAPSVVRDGGETKKLPLPQPTDRVQLQLELEEGAAHKSYTATLRTAQGATVWQRSGLRAQQVSGGQIISLQLPALSLQTGKYEVQLSGSTNGGQPELVSYYYFHITPKQ